MKTIKDNTGEKLQICEGHFDRLYDLFKKGVISILAKKNGKFYQILLPEIFEYE